MRQKTDFIVIGSGIAGIRAAIELASEGDVVVLTKSRADESNTEYAQGGIAVAMNDEDEIGLHRQDTVVAGDGLCDETAVGVLVEEGPSRILELIDWGTHFDKEGAKLAFTREAAHSRKRILHAGGDSTGREINRTLIRKVRTLPNVRLVPHSFALELLVEAGECRGVRYLDQRTRTVGEILANSVLLATGGIGVVYRETTNPDVATGDGFSLALRAGAVLADMEFVQFHPTALNAEGIPHFLLSEAMRGEGAKLKNGAGEQFMGNYHPLEELAPRDVVSRSIFLETHRRKENHVLLDLTHMDPGFVRRRFPQIYGTCLSLGLDITQNAVPVYPAAHYMMGGVYIDLQGRTTIPGLFAAGEVTCNGVHGANRLASNSLLDGLVFGARAGRAMIERAYEFGNQLGGPVEERNWLLGRCSDEGAASDRAVIRELMSEFTGIARERTGMERALRKLDRMCLASSLESGWQERNNLLINARIMTAAALFREESRGSHFRKDFPERDDENWLKHILIQWNARAGKLLFRSTRHLNSSRGP